MNLFMNLAHRVYRVFLNAWRINWIATCYFNLRILPLRKALHFPILLYGKIKFHGLTGEIEINEKVKLGMIKIGYRWIDLWPSSYLPTQLLIRGTLTFNGDSIISGGVYLGVFNTNSRLIIGKNVVIGGGSMVKAVKYIEIGNKTRITSNCTIFDSNMHFVKDIISGKIANKDGEIFIGRNCWINSGAIIAKGAVIPNYSIVARNSFVSKDMSSEGDNAFICGSPAKILKIGVQRIFSDFKERELTSYFVNNPDKKIFNASPGLEIDL